MKPKSASERARKRAETDARRMNQRTAAAMPLFDYAGILDQVAQPVTADALLAKRERQRNAWAERRARIVRTGLEMALAAFLEARAAGVDIEAAWSTWGAYPYSPEYIAHFWKQQAASKRQG